MLLERDRELCAAAGVLEAAVEGRGGVAWIEGPAGIGKTRLLDAACDHAAALGMQVLAARAEDLERDFAFGVIRGLFEPLLTGAGPVRRADLLSGAARLAAPVITLDGQTPGAEPAASLGTLHGVYWLAVNLADGAPVMLAVDDAHWADTASLRALAYLAPRLAELPVALVVAARTPGPRTDPTLLDAIRDAEATAVLRPQPLTRAAADRIVDGRLPGPSSAAFRAACHDATTGNPLLLRALLTVLDEAGVTPDDAGVAAVTAHAPAVVATAVDRRLQQVGPQGTAVARAVAVLGGRAELRHVAAVTGLGPSEVAEAADALVAVRLLVAGRPLAFAPPWSSRPSPSGPAWSNDTAPKRRVAERPPTGSRTANSRRRCSSRPRPSRPTSATPTASSASPGARRWRRRWAEEGPPAPPRDVDITVGSSPGRG